MRGRHAVASSTFPHVQHNMGVDLKVLLGNYLGLLLVYEGKI